MDILSKILLYLQNQHANNSKNLRLDKISEI